MLEELIEEWMECDYSTEIRLYNQICQLLKEEGIE